MGGKQSVILSPEEARARLTHAEIHMLEQGYARVVRGDRSGGLSFEGFKTTLLAELSPKMPQSLAECIFNAFDRGRTGKLSFDELLCGIAIIRQGTPEERLQLVFNSCGLKQSGRLSAKELRSYLRLQEAYENRDANQLLFKPGVMETNVRTLFPDPHETTVGFSEFKDWACRYVNEGLLFWVFELDRLLAPVLEDVDCDEGNSSRLRSRSGSGLSSLVYPPSHAWTHERTPPPSPLLVAQNAAPSSVHGGESLLKGPSPSLLVLNKDTSGDRTGGVKRPRAESFDSATFPGQSQSPSLQPQQHYENSSSSSSSGCGGGGSSNFGGGNDDINAYQQHHHRHQFVRSPYRLQRLARARADEEHRRSRALLDFGDEGLATLKQLFLKCQERSATGAVDLEALVAVFGAVPSAPDGHTKSGGGSLPRSLLVRIFRTLDEDGNGTIDLREFIGGLCCCFGGSVEEKLSFVFSLWATSIECDELGEGNRSGEEDEDYFCESNKSMVSMKDGAVFACEGSSPITVASPSPSSRDMRRVGVRRRREGATAEVSEVLTRSAMYQLVKSLWSVEELNKASAISSSPFNFSSSSSASSSSPMDLSRGTLDDEISDVLENSAGISPEGSSPLETPRFERKASSLAAAKIEELVDDAFERFGGTGGVVAGGRRLSPRLHANSRRRGRQDCISPQQHSHLTNADTTAVAASLSSLTGDTEDFLTKDEFDAWALDTTNSSSGSGDGRKETGNLGLGSLCVAAKVEPLTDHIQHVAYLEMGIRPTEAAVELRLVREVARGLVAQECGDRSGSGGGANNRSVSHDGRQKMWRGGFRVIRGAACVIEKDWVDGWLEYVGRDSLYEVFFGVDDGSGGEHEIRNQSDERDNVCEGTTLARSDTAKKSNAPDDEQSADKDKSSFTSRTSTDSRQRLVRQRSAKKHLPPIDNHGLLSYDGLTLRSTTSQHDDFEVLPYACYAALSAWYGGGPLIERRVIPTRFLSGDGCSDGEKGKMHDRNDHGDNAEQNQQQRRRRRRRDGGDTADSGVADSQMDGVEVDLFPPLLTFESTEERHPQRTVLASAAHTLGDLWAIGAGEFGCAPEATRLWAWDAANLLVSPHCKGSGTRQVTRYPETPDREYGSDGGARAASGRTAGSGEDLWVLVFRENWHLTLRDVCEGDPRPRFLVEVQTSNGSWPRSSLASGSNSQPSRLTVDSPSPSSTSSGGDKNLSSKRTQPPLPPPPPLGVGMVNLGNTCYMNATLQALAHTTLFNDYFTLRAAPPLILGNEDKDKKRSDIEGENVTGGKRSDTVEGVSKRKSEETRGDANDSNSILRINGKRAGNSGNMEAKHKEQEENAITTVVTAAVESGDEIINSGEEQVPVPNAILPFRYQYDINVGELSHRFGMAGKLAVALAELLQEVREVDEREQLAYSEQLDLSMSGNGSDCDDQHDANNIYLKRSNSSSTTTTTTNTTIASSSSSLMSSMSSSMAAFASSVKSWRGISVRPYAFKYAISQYRQQFQGHQQHDASELLQCILEGVSEDLNRLEGMKEKPYVESPDGADLTPEGVVAAAALCWEHHWTRENHIATALFAGQLKSTTTCSVTGASSTSFEQFTALPVPLPPEGRRFYTAVVVFNGNPLQDQNDGSGDDGGSLRNRSSLQHRAPLKVGVAVPRSGCVGDLLAAVVVVVDRGGNYYTGPESPMKSNAMFTAASASSTRRDKNLEGSRSALGEGDGDDDNSGETPLSLSAKCLVAAYAGPTFVTAALDPEKPLEDVPEHRLLYVFQVATPEVLPKRIIDRPLTVGDPVLVWNGNALGNSWKRATIVDAPSVRGKFGDDEGVVGVHAGISTRPDCKVRGKRRVVSPSVPPPRSFSDDEEASVGVRFDLGGDLWVPRRDVQRCGDVPCLVFVSLRVPVKVDQYFLDPSRFQLFGNPFVLRVVPSRTTGEELYALVWQHISALFDALEEAPYRVATNTARETNSRSVDPEKRWRFTIRRAFNMRKRHGSSVGTGVGGGGSVQSILSDPTVADPLLVKDTPISSSRRSLLQVDDSEPLVVDIPESWRAAFNQRLAGHIAEHPSLAALRQERHRPVDLVSDCLRSLVAPEEVTAFSRALTQRNGGEYSESRQMKVASLFRAPPVLVVTLKRFTEMPLTGSRAKLCTSVEFPVQGLDLTEFLDPCVSSSSCASPPPVYNLCAVVNHIGSLIGGHYTCFAKKHGRWLHYDDSSVSEVHEESDIVTHHAYILFYERQDLGAYHDKNDQRTHGNGKVGSTSSIEDLFPVQPSTRAKDPEDVKMACWNRQTLGMAVIANPGQEQDGLSYDVIGVFHAAQSSILALIQIIGVDGDWLSNLLTSAAVCALIAFCINYLLARCGLLNWEALNDMAREPWQHEFEH